MKLNEFIDKEPAYKQLPCIKEVSVSELTSLLKKTIDENFGYIKVKGEVSGLKIATSGHAYFNLRENDAILACTCWRGSLSKLKFRIEEGMEIIASGNLAIYSGQSKYQLSVDYIESTGIGSLMQALMKRKEAFAKEGLFDALRKKRIPRFPESLGIITSPSGAVIQDIIHRARDRFPIKIILWPVSVQGEKCPFEVSEAIRGFSEMDSDMRPDTIIIARGGGSVEDLWGFNDELVVRAAANSNIPIISAIGHETDFTLLDFASSLRAPTPTAAAEMALPVARDVIFWVQDTFARCINIVNGNLEFWKRKLEALDKSFYNSKLGLYDKYQRIDDLSFRLSNSLPSSLKITEANLLGVRLPASLISSIISRKESTLNALFEKITTHNNSIIAKLEADINLLSQLLESLDIDKILARGFVLARDSNGKTISSSIDAQKSSQIMLQWHDGEVKAKVLIPDNGQ
ncbi:MAG: exodeoxyribonuclease VII large subunit [Alphaproteobacteria bacterium]|nr:exodeoxyribonuclease VII large subunit [Alphaproteobacteria bacterium]